MSSEIAEFFNLELGDALSSINKIEEVVERLSNYKEDLEREINPEESVENGMISYTKNAQNAVEKIKDLMRKCESLEEASESELLNLKPIQEDFSSKVKELKETECLHNYFQWILRVEKQNDIMEEVLPNGLSYNIIDGYLKFKEYWTQLRNSECKHLLSYVRRTMVYWHEVLLKKFGDEFHKVLVSMHWPVASANLKSSSMPIVEASAKFSQLFMALYQITLPDSYVKMQDVNENSEDPVIILPLRLMLIPLQKRFTFHFMSKKPTNRLDKPEWYFTQILSWISDHSMFLETYVEPIIEKEQLSCLCVHMQLMRGLMRLAITRLNADLPNLLDDDRLLSHTIDEILLFSKEIEAQGYPSSFPNALQILSSEPCFTRWRSLEHQSSLEKMDKFLSFETAWKSRYQEESELDELQVPESAELFVTLLLTMTERYCSVSDKDCQVSFLELQLELLDDFRLRLHQLSQCQQQETIQSSYCGIMNAIHYITCVLEEWNNLPFFLQLYSHKKRKHLCEVLLKSADNPISPLKRRSKSTEDEDIPEASVFDEANGLFQHMQKDLLQSLSDRVLMDIKAKSRSYRKEKWFCVPPIEDKKLMEMSLSAYPMLEVINSSMQSLQEFLAKPLFTKIWQHIAMELDFFIYEEVILQNSFSEGGAAQLNFDMTRNLFPIFGTYTLKPASYFKLIRDSCVLLNLNNAAALLLRETLKLQENFESKSSALEELDVHSLSPSQASIILSQRNYVNL